MTVNKKKKTSTKIKEKDLNYDNNSLYFGYKSRVSILIVLFTVLAIIIYLLVGRLINYQTRDNVRLIEVGKINYQAVLKENYINNDNIVNEEDNVSLVSSLIDKINLNFNYKVNYEKDVKSSYHVIVREVTTIYNAKNEDMRYYVEEKDLFNNKTSESILDNFSYNPDVTIDYNKYNDIVNEFKNKYKNDVKAKVDVYLLVKSNLSPVDYVDKKSMDSKLMATISLGDDTVIISKELINNGKTIPFSKNTISYYRIALEVLIIIFILVIIIVFIKLNKLLSKLQPRDNKYERELRTLLRDYDRSIVNVEVMPDEKLTRVPVEEFDELLDLKENTGEPIRYYEVSPHNKSYFFIKYKDEVFIYTLKNISYEK